MNSNISMYVDFSLKLFISESSFNLGLNQAPRTLVSKARSQDLKGGICRNAVHLHFLNKTVIKKLLTLTVKVS